VHVLGRSESLRVFGAKIVVFGVLSFVVAEVTSFVAFFLGQFLLSSPATHATLSSPGAFRAVFGVAFSSAPWDFSPWDGTIIRHTAGAISAFVAVLLVLPIITAALPSQLAQDIRKFMPDRIGSTCSRRRVKTLGRSHRGSACLLSASTPWYCSQLARQCWKNGTLDFLLG